MVDLEEPLDAEAAGRWSVPTEHVWTKERPAQGSEVAPRQPGPWLVPSKKSGAKWLEPVSSRRLIQRFIELGTARGQPQLDAIRLHANGYGGLTSHWVQSLQLWQREIEIAAAALDAVDFCMGGHHHAAERREAMSWIEEDGGRPMVRLGPVVISYGDPVLLRRAARDEAFLAEAIRATLIQYLSARLRNDRMAEPYGAIGVVASENGIRYLPTSQWAAVNAWILKQAVGRRPGAVGRPDRHCKYCDQLFQPRRRGHIFCNERCTDLWRYHHKPERRERAR